MGRRLRAIVGSRRFREVLQVRTRRRPFALRVGGVDAAEVALDDTVIVVGTGQRPMQLRRVEVEVQPEWLDALEPLVEQLRTSCGLQPARLSKFEAGLLAVGQEIPGSPDLGPTAVSESSTMGELAFAVVRRQLAVLRDKEPGTRLGEDPEELHDMRVATRRLRAALALFAGVLPVRAQTYREELGWLGRRAGRGARPRRATRELGRCHRGGGEWSAGHHADQRDALAELARAPRARARGGAGGDVERSRLGALGATDQGPGRDGRSRARRGVPSPRAYPAVIGMPELVAARHAAVAKAAKRAKRSGVVSDFHRLRIRCKRLRYALEFSAEVYGGRTARYVRRLTALQDELGLMQDAEVAALRLADWPPARSSSRPPPCS